MSDRGFWQDLSLPIFGLAPMDGVTDAAFRFIVAKYGRPSLVMTEFTSVEGIRAGAERLLDDFAYSELERPVVAQLFGSDPAAFYLGAVVAAALGFDGVDINMGCPAKTVTQRGAGAALILDPPRAREIIRQAKEGVRAWAEGISLEEALVPENIIALIRTRHPLPDRAMIPVSVKTRIGYDAVVVEEWVDHLLQERPANITVHGRTLKQMYSGLADWEAIGRAAARIHQTDTSVLGNGDVQSLADARGRIADYGVDGVLIGRAAFGNPWLFQEREAGFDERMRTALEHARYLHTLFPGKGFIRVRKHLLDYCKGVEGAKELRVRLMRVSALSEVEEILSDYA